MKITLADLANNEFYLFNRWGYESGDSRCGMNLSFAEKTATLYPKDDTASWTPWQFKPVPGTNDQFYLFNRWGCENGEPRCGMNLSFAEKTATLYPEDDLSNQTPWQLQPVPGTDDQFYLFNRWGCESGDSRCGMNLSLAYNIATLYPEDDLANRTAWQLLPAGSTPREPNELPITRQNWLPRLAGHMPQGKTDEVLVSKVKMSFLLVKDPELNVHEQIQKSPYYELKTYVYWLGDAKSFIGNAGNSEPRTQTITETLTNSEELSTTVSNTFTVGVSVTGSVGVELKGVSASVETTVSTEWSSERSRTRTTGFERSISISDTVTAGSHKSAQLFTRVVKEQLVRGDGSIAREWEVFSDITQTDEYPD